MGIRKRGQTYEVRIIRKAIFKPLGILSGIYTFTVTNKVQAESDFNRICASIDAGNIPAEILNYARDAVARDCTHTLNSVWEIMRNDPHYDPSQSVVDLLASMLDTMGEIVLVHFDRAALLAWIEKMKADGLAPGTIRKKVGAIRAIFKYAAIDDDIEITKNIFDLLPTGYSEHKGSKDKHNKTVRRDVSRERRLNPGEYEMILAAIEKHKLDSRQKNLNKTLKPAMCLMFEIAVNTGMRLQEIFLMKIENISFNKRGVIRIPAVDTKANTERFVPMSSFLYPLLQSYIDVNALSSGDLFPFMSHYNNNIEKCSRGLSRIWRQIAKTANTDGLRFHDLRHEGISRMVERTTLTMAQLMKISGHGDMRTFQRYVNLRATEIGEMY